MREPSQTKKNESCVHKRILEDAKKEFEGNKMLRSIEVRKIVIEKQEEAIKSSQTKAKLLLKQAHLLMEDSEKMSTFLEKEKKDLDKSEKRVQQSITKSTCQKIVRKQHNYNENE